MHRHTTCILLLALACRSPDATPRDTFPAPESMPPLLGPGGPAVAMEQDSLFDNCAFLPGGESDVGHHNLVAPYRGHLVMPWAPEWGGSGGLSLFDVSDPCSPVLVGETTSPNLRETHAMGFVHLPEGDPHAGDWAVMNHIGGLEPSGVQFWDLSVPEDPQPVSSLGLPGVTYPDAYTLISLSMFWQYPWVYVAAANNGVFVIDATDPLQPELVTQVTFDTGLRAGGVFALGNLLMVSSAEGEQVALMDISVPDDPQMIGGGLFETLDRDGIARESYHANMVGNWALFARKEDGGGPVVYDISDPTDPYLVSDLLLPGTSSGYIFYDEGYLFVGGSSAAHVIDATDITDLKVKGVGLLEGDLDTITPYGNVALLAVDDKANAGEATAVMPWTEQPDRAGPAVLRIDPPDGATGIAPSARIGIGFNEFVEPSSVFAGSIRLYDAEDYPVDGWGSAQEAIATYTPKVPLTPGTTYRIEVLADGVMDLNGNRVSETVTSTFTTAD